MKWDEYLAARLSPNACQVLLSLLLVRQLETGFSQAEYATRAGLSRRSAGNALRELENLGLVKSIPRPGRTPLVRITLFDEEEYRDAKDDIVPLKLLAPPLAQLPPGPNDRAGNSTSEQAHREPVRADEDGPRESSEKVHDGGERHGAAVEHEATRADQIVTLQQYWDRAFPRADYPVQRLTRETAKKLLHYGTAEEVGEYILDLVDKAPNKIESPRAYVLKSIRDWVPERASSESPEEDPVINDELREFTRLINEQRRRKYG